MSANIDTLLSVREVPWHGLGVILDTSPKTAREIIEIGKLGWTVSAMPMYADFHDDTTEMKSVPNWHVVYRDDTKNVLGVINRKLVTTVQNEDMFNSIEPLMGNYIETETAASLGYGENVFGCFKIKDEYKVADDTFTHYFVVLNEHNKSDGKVTVLNTPVRVVCQNTLASALSNNIMKMRIPVTADHIAASLLSHKLEESVEVAHQQLELRAEFMLKQKVSPTQREMLLDELFPYIQTNDDDSIESSHERANERTMMIRDIFVNECIGAENLANYEGTAYQLYNASTDFFQHYWANVENAYDLNKRMQTLPGYGVSESVSKVNKTLQFLKKVA